MSLIIVVDDNKDCAELQAMLLRAWGHEVVVAYNGKAAASLARDRPPDVMLIDIAMPEMDGVELARLIKNDPACTHARLVAISGHSQHDIILGATEVGFHEYLVKPVDPDVLKQLVEAPYEQR